MTISWDTAPIKLPPVAKKPCNNGGVVHGVTITAFGQNPIEVNTQPTKIQINEVKMNGMSKIGFNTNGIPNVIV